MKIEKYETFEVEDFIEDVYFRYWILEKDEQAEQFWQQFLEAYPTKKSQIFTAKHLIQSIHQHFETNIQQVKQEQAKLSWQQFSDKIESPNRIVSLRRKWLPWSAAATILLCIATVALYVNYQPTVTHTYATGNGQRMSLYLPDSTLVELNANSTLSLSPDTWTTNNFREVQLQGEAYFKVTHQADETKFIVHAGEVAVAVLGTAFNIRAREQNAEVVLAEGKIELAIADQTIAMRPGDLVSYSKAQSKVESKKVKPSDYSAWKDGMVVFNKKLSEVVKDLEILYGVRFTIEKEDLKNRFIQLSAPSDSIEQVLNTLELMYSEEISIETNGQQIRIF